MSVFVILLVLVVNILIFLVLIVFMNFLVVITHVYSYGHNLVHNFPCPHYVFHSLSFHCVCDFLVYPLHGPNHHPIVSPLRFHFINL